MDTRAGTRACADRLRRLHAGGVRIVTGIDAGIGPWVAHGNLHRGVSQLEDAGFSPGEAVAAATSDAARVCGLKHRKGLLGKGYDADLIGVDVTGRSTSDRASCRW
jgi:imidazolonepropionase-like amidohydrolase